MFTTNALLKAQDQMQINYNSDYVWQGGINL